MAGMTEPTPGDWQAYSDPAKGCSFVVADMRDTVARCDRIADAVAMSATKELAGIAERWLRLFDRGGTAEETQAVARDTRAALAKYRLEVKG